jgi:MFS superfamily sulfate permease-like transporter
LPDFSEFNIHAAALGILTVLIYYLIPLLTKAIPSALAALIIGALTSYFLGWDVPIIERFHLEFQIYRLEPIQQLYQKHTP